MDMTMTKTALKEPATELMALCDAVGQRRAAELLGMGKGSVNQMYRDGLCRPAYNLASKMLMAERGRPEKEMLYFVKVDPDKRELFETFVKGLNFKFRTFVD